MLVIGPGWKSQLEIFSVQFSLSLITYFDFLEVYINGGNKKSFAGCE